MHYPLFLGKHVVDDEYTNWLYKPFYFLSVVFGFVNTQGPNISVDGRRLFLFGLILHQTPSQFLPHVELFSEGRKALTSQLLCKRERFLSCLKFVSQPGWQDGLNGPLSEWMVAEVSVDLLCQQLRGHYTAARYRACLPRLQRFLCVGHRKRPHLYSLICRWLGMPAAPLGERAVVS